MNPDLEELDRCYELEHDRYYKKLQEISDKLDSIPELKEKADKYDSIVVDVESAFYSKYQILKSGLEDLLKLKTSHENCVSRKYIKELLEKVK